MDWELLCMSREEAVAGSQRQLLGWCFPGALPPVQLPVRAAVTLSLAPELTAQLTGGSADAAVCTVLSLSPP